MPHASTPDSRLAALLGQLAALAADADADAAAYTTPAPDAGADRDLSLTDVLAQLPPGDVARSMQPAVLERLRETAKKTQTLLDEQHLPREFRKQPAWWDGRRGPPEEKTRVILDDLIALATECWDKDTPLASVVLTDCRFDEDESQRLRRVLGHCTALTRLDLSGGQIDWSAIPDTAAFDSPSLAHLDLSRCELDLRELAEVLRQWQCTDLAFLDLSHNRHQRDNPHSHPPRVFPRGDAHAALLAHVTRLARLNLAENFIGDDQARALTPFLISNTRLTHLDLSLNKMSDSGARFVAKALSTSSVLTHLNLSSNPIEPNGFRGLAADLANIHNLTHLSLAYCRLCSPWGETRTGPSYLARMLRTCTALQSIDLEGNNILPDGARALAGVLATCSALQDLNLNRNDVQFQGVAYLAPVFPQCKALRSLALNGNDIQDIRDLLACLPSCARLARLDLAYNSIASEAACQLATIMPQCSALCSLNLRGNRVEASAAHTLVDALLTQRARPFTLNLLYNAFWNDEATHARLAQKCAGTNVRVESRRDG